MKKFLSLFLCLLMIMAFTAGCMNGTGRKTEDENPDSGDIEPVKGLIINQVMGIGEKSNDEQSASHSFVELYNAAEETVNLSEYTVQSSGIGIGWQSVKLNGELAPNHSYLIRLTKYVCAGARLKIDNSDLDWNAGFVNKNLKVALIKSVKLLTVANPFNIDGTGKKVIGYTDMIGVAGNGAADSVDGCEEEYLCEQSKQKSLRRKDFLDTDNNAEDLEVIDYREANINRYRPRSLADGAWYGLPQLELPKLEPSHKSGVYASPFTLTVTDPANEIGMRIFYTIDGTEPTPGSSRKVYIDGNEITLNGEVKGSLYVTDRSGYWRNGYMTRRSENYFNRPIALAETLRGTSYRFKGYVGNEAVTDTLTATYIISSDFNERFNNLPVVFVTAPAEEFFDLYNNPLADKKYIFNYEYMVNSGGKYTPVFSLPGSTGIGGVGSSGFGQKTLNVNLAKSPLAGEITYPIFEDVPSIKRFRLWNGGNQFAGDFNRDAFMQKASKSLNVDIAESNLCIEFVNGEYWGFSTMREHYDGDYAQTHFGIEKDNAAQMKVEYYRDSDSTPHFEFVVEDGGASKVQPLFNEFINFLLTADLTADVNREKLFSKYFDEDNFIDYIIVNTYFANLDWPANNIRLFRAIEPEQGKPKGDGKWRYVLHDMDLAAYTRELLTQNIVCGNDINLFVPGRLFNYSYIANGAETIPKFNHIYKVFGNPAFKSKFKARALQVVNTVFETETLSGQYNAFQQRLEPLLTDMLTRFNMFSNTNYSLQDNLNNYNLTRYFMNSFLNERKGHYVNQINAL